MAAKSSTDEFANVATITVTESAANTLTYKKLETGISLNEKVAWVINRVEYFATGNFSTDFNTANDRAFIALSVAQTMATLSAAASYVDPTLLDLYVLSREDFGIASSGGMFERPFVKDFSTLPGGGIIVPPTPLYAAVQGVGLANPQTVVVKMYYTLLNLSTDQYWQLVEARRIISS